MVEFTLAIMSRSKALGLDEWRVFETRHWKPEFEDRVPELLNTVEQQAVVGQPRCRDHWEPCSQMGELMAQWTGAPYG